MGWCFRIVVTVLTFVRVMTCLKHIPVVHKPTGDNVNIEVIQETMDNNGRSMAFHLLPDKLSIDINKGNEKRVRLNLTRNSGMKQDIPISVERNGRILYQFLEQPDIVNFYQDKLSCASFLVTKVNPATTTLPNSLYRFIGTFYLGSDLAMVQLSNSSSPVYQLTLLPKPELTFDHVKEDHPQFEEHGVSLNRSRLRRSDKTKYEIEMLVVADYSVYTFWYQHSEGKSIIEKDKDAKISIRDFYGLVMNSVDLRYQTIDNTDFEVRVLMTGVHIADTKSSSLWTENNKIDEDGTRVNANKMIKDFRTWWNNQDSLIKKHDHAMLFTKMNLTTVTSEGYHNIIGFASVSALCKTYRQSLVQDDFYGVTPVTAAHELGHSLGAQHDDEPENECQGEDEYIMAATQSSLDEPDELLRRQWRFSECSVDYFRKYITKLNMEKNNCLAERSGVRIVGEIPYELPGHIYGPDTQCENAVGAGSFLGRFHEGPDFSEICIKMPCVIPDRYGYHYNVEPLDGTLCGPGKVCKFGKCQDSSDIGISMNGKCLFGDSPGIIGKDDGTCAEEVGSPRSAYKCYNSYYRSRCCETCQRHTEMFGISNDCKYGDKVDNCQEQLCHLYQDSSRYQTSCCYTCRHKIELPTRTLPHYVTSPSVKITHWIFRPFTTAQIPSIKPYVGSCIRSCTGVVDGDYQSCLGCHIYASCYRQTLYDERPCPAGLVWTDDLKRCEFDSNTC